MQVHRARLNAPVARRSPAFATPVRGHRSAELRVDLTAPPTTSTHDRVARSVEPGSTWVMATGVTAPPTGEEKGCRLGMAARPPARLSAYSRRATRPGRPRASRPSHP